MTTNNNTALDLDLFDNDVNGYVPEELPEKKKKAQKLFHNEGNGPQGNKNNNISPEFRKALTARACAFATAAFLILTSIIYFRVVYTEKQIELDNAKKELAAAESEYIVLEIELNSKYSPDVVTSYAQDSLNMNQYENYQAKYYEYSGSDGARLTTGGGRIGS